MAFRGFEHVGAADHVGERAEAELRHEFAHFLRDELHEVHGVLRIAGEFRAQLRILRGDADGAGVQMADAHHDAAERDERRGREAELLRAEQRGDDDVAAGLHLAVRLDDDAERRLFSTSVWCVSARPSSHGMPACLIEVCGEAPVPPSKPEMSTTSACAFATPAAIVPTPTSRHELHADARVRGSSSSDRGSVPRDPRWSRCRDAAAAR